MKVIIYFWAVFLYTCFFIIQNDEPLPEDVRFITEYHKETVTLTINDVTIDDEGYFKCEARNEHGTATTVIELFVQSKPNHPAWIDDLLVKHVSIKNCSAFLSQIMFTCSSYILDNGDFDLLIQIRGRDWWFFDI